MGEYTRYIIKVDILTYESDHRSCLHLSKLFGCFSMMYTWAGTVLSIVLLLIPPCRYDEWIEEQRIAGRLTGPSKGFTRPVYKVCSVS